MHLCKFLSDEKFTYWNIPTNKLFSFREEFIPGIPSVHRFFDDEKGFEKAEKLLDQRIKAGYVPFYKYLANVFPLGTLNNSVTAEINKPIKGNYTFRVSLSSRIWRDIKLSHKHTLEDLHLATQQAFDFDNDHLYSFFMDGKRYSKDAYHNSWSEEGPYTNEAIIGAL